jgi:glycerol-3-phosphate acyltransferase PlsY
LSTPAIYAITIPVAYLLGAIPWGYIFPKALRGIDIRQYGSGNTGMANVLRTVGWRIAAIVVVLDVGKGALAVVLAWTIGDHAPLVGTVAAIAALVGHDWSIFLRFNGGRGSATGLGCTFAVTPYVALISLSTFIAIVLKSRYVSLGSICAAITSVLVYCIFAAFGVYSWTYIYFFVIAGAIVVFQHRGNIKRLLNGTERKIGQSAAPSSEAGTTANR